MFIAPRPLPDDDPLFAVRIAVMPVIAIMLAGLLHSPMPMIYPTLMFSLIASNRKAFNPGRVFAAPIVFAAALWIMSGIFLALQPLPVTLVLVMGLIFFLAFYIIQRTGTSIGMLIIVAGVLMSVMGLGSYTAMAYLRAEMTKAALCSAVVIPILYMVLPPRTSETHVDDAAPSFDYGWAQRAAIRAVVMLAYAFYLYTIIDFSNVMLGVAGMYVLVHSTRQSIWREAAQRSFSVVLGGALAMAILGVLLLAGHLSVLLLLTFLVTFWLGTKMLSGRLPSMTYQDAASVMISIVGSSLSTAEPGFAFMQRAGLTIAGTIVAALAVSILDRLLVGEPDTIPDAIADRNALENL